MILYIHTCSGFTGERRKEVAVFHVQVLMMGVCGVRSQPKVTRYETATHCYFWRGPSYSGLGTCNSIQLQLEIIIRVDYNGRTVTQSLHLYSELITVKSNLQTMPIQILGCLSV